MIGKGYVARRGVTLVELLIAMLILALVSVAWLEIIGVQSARKEARRREAVERLAGMMDAFMYENRKNMEIAEGGYYMVTNKSELFETTSDVKPIYSDGGSSIGYQLRVVTIPTDDTEKPILNGMLKKYWGTKKWLVGCLYDKHGVKTEVGNPFFVLPAYLGVGYGE